MPLTGSLLLCSFFCFRLNSLILSCLSFPNCKCELVTCSEGIRCRGCTNNSYQEAEVWSWVTQLIPGKVADLSLQVLFPYFYNGHHQVGLPSHSCFLEELITDDKVLDKHSVLNGIWQRLNQRWGVDKRKDGDIFFIPTLGSYEKVFHGYRHTVLYTITITYNSNWHLLKA